MPIVKEKFKREKHVYRNEKFSELLLDAVRFFHGTPVLPLPPEEPFKGAGVYAIYCIARTGIYKTFGETINRKSYSVPIYVGKAVPTGWRQNRNIGSENNTTLFNRLRQHAESIKAGKGLNLADFACRFAILEGETANMVAALEAAIIAEHSPLWNSVIDGFGNHDPGKRRVTGKRPQWDCLHPGRPWAMRMSGEAFSVPELKRRVTDYLMGVKCTR
ncbi:MAG: Eco29kI family restriction endonuclease [Kiritimatiellae bacterium]|nr:Eco29kI family restriction endonuclease [Kiritimatiellia bacterium]